MLDVALQKKYLFPLSCLIHHFTSSKQIEMCFTNKYHLFSTTSHTELNKSDDKYNMINQRIETPSVENLDESLMKSSVKGKPN